MEHPLFKVSFGTSYNHIVSTKSHITGFVFAVFVLSAFASFTAPVAASVTLEDSGIIASQSVSVGAQISHVFEAIYAGISTVGSDILNVLGVPAAAAGVKLVLIVVMLLSALAGFEKMLALLKRFGQAVRGNNRSLLVPVLKAALIIIVGLMAISAVCIPQNLADHFLNSALAFAPVRCEQILQTAPEPVE